MIYCTILTGPRHEPAETFTEATIRYACVPDVNTSHLAVSVDRSAFMQVVIDDDVVFTETVHPERKLFDLLKLLKLKPAKTGVLPKLTVPGLSRLMRRLEEEPKPASAFSVVFRDGGESDRVVATYEFNILDARVFDTKHRAHCSIVDPRAKPAVFTTDARSPETALNCYNCGNAVKPDDCCKNCGAPPKSEDDETVES